MPNKLAHILDHKFKNWQEENKVKNSSNGDHLKRIVEK